jgi:hypothetical protein
MIIPFTYEAIYGFLFLFPHSQIAKAMWMCKSKKGVNPLRQKGFSLKKKWKEKYLLSENVTKNRQFTECNGQETGSHKNDNLLTHYYMEKITSITSVIIEKN